MHDLLAGYVERGDVPGIVTLVSRRLVQMLAREGRPGANRGDALHAVFGFWFRGARGVGCAANGRGASARVLDSVDLLVEALAGLAAEDGGGERDGERRDQRDHAAGRQ